MNLPADQNSARDAAQHAHTSPHAPAATFVIVGAGQAGATAAAELRQQGFAGRIVLIGEEPHAPYERPPLSKGRLLDPENTRCHIFADDFYVERNIELKRGVRATRLDPAAHTLSLDDGTTQAWDKLLLATGSRARALPLLDGLGAGVYVLRTLDDADGLLREIRPGRRILVVGGGVIGLELASSIVDLGAHATVIEQAPSVMGRNAPEPLRALLLDVHRARGVAFHLGAAITAARREGGKAEGEIQGKAQGEAGDKTGAKTGGEIVLQLQDGTTLRGDAVVYGIGAELRTELAAAAGLKIEAGGIAIDAHGRTSHPDIYAAGDVASQQVGQQVAQPGGTASGQYQRLETWENANRQALTAARAMLGIEQAETGVPWFWTDQCGKNIQFAGDMSAPEWLLRGSTDDAGFIWFGLREGIVVGAVAVNKGREVRNLKGIIAKGGAIDPARLQDPATDLRKL